MTQVIGKIESLKALKTKLENNRVTRFSSVSEIQNFQSSFNLIKQKVLSDTSDNLLDTYHSKKNDLANNKKKKTISINIVTKSIDDKIDALERSLSLIEQNRRHGFLNNIIYGIHSYTAKSKLNYTKNNRTSQIQSKVNHLTNQIKADENFINEYENDLNRLIHKTAKKRLETLNHTLNVVNDSKSLIAGAIGENLVVKEIEKLSDDYVLINDFQLRFEKPIYYKKGNGQIHSIQIDHLLISKSGIFILETKNWSKSTVNSSSLRSPVDQVRRSSFALYVWLSNNVILNDNWGNKKISLRNVIVMIRHKPISDFNFVTVKLLKELNSYVSYFEPVLSSAEVKKITSKLLK